MIRTLCKNTICILFTAACLLMMTSIESYSQCSVSVSPGATSTCTNSSDSYYGFQGTTPCQIVSVQGAENYIEDYGTSYVWFGSVPGTYNIQYNCPCGLVNVPVTITDPPQIFTMSGGGTICQGNTAVIQLDGSQAGTTYQLSTGGYSQTLAGTGNPLQFTVSQAGSYTMIASNSCGNELMESGLGINVTVSAIPTDLAVQGGGTFCEGSSSTTITMPSTQSGITYQLLRNDNHNEGSRSGTGGQVTWSVSPGAGSWTYRVIATNTGNCSKEMSSHPAITVNAVPLQYTVSGGGPVCTGGTGANIMLSNSEAGVKYQLQLNGSNSGPPLPGNGGPLTWSNQASAGTYTVVATRDGTSCSRPMSQNATVVINPVPNLFITGGGGSYCSGSNGVFITLNGSQSGASYQLRVDGSNTGSPINGTGSPLTWLNQTTTGTYTIVASYSSTGCSVTMSNSATVTMNPLPAQYAIQGGGAFCSGGTGVSVVLNNSESNVNYQLLTNGTTNGLPVPGTGGSITWAGQKTSGTYTVVASHAVTGCTRVMQGDATVVVNPLPTPYTVQGGGSYCSGATGVSVTLAASQAGVRYQLQIAGVDTGPAVSGTGSALSWPNQTTASTYSVVATVVATGCTLPMPGSANVTIIPLPTQYAVAGGGSYCSGGSGVNITLNNSQSGVHYQLKLSGADVGLPVTGTGSALTWASQTTAGTYTVVGTTTGSSCARTMDASASVTIDPLPAQFALSGGGSYCSGGSGRSIALDGSQTTTQYQLLLNGVNTGSAVTGTGDPLTWTNLTTPGDYKVRATSAASCSRDMNGNINVSVVPLISTISGPSAIGDAPVTLAASAGSSYTYQWKLEGVVIPDETSYSIQISESGHYQVEITGSGCPQQPVVHYVRMGTQQYFNGLISSVRWRTGKAHGTTENDYKGMYTYTYDDKYQVREAQWSIPDFATNTFATAGNVYKVSNLAYDANGNILSLRRHDQNGARTNDFTYHYAPNNNRLLDVTGHTSNNNAAGHGYAYNEIGQMTDQDLLTGNDQYVEYDVSGKVRKVFSNPARTEQYLKVEFLYDDNGFRLAKINHETDKTTWYIRDAAGAILSVYEEDRETHALAQTEIPIYAAGKLGTHYPGAESEAAYEITDHLGNVRALVREVSDVSIATLETDRANEEQSKFLRYNNVRSVNATLFDHTGGATTNYAMRLNGSANERIGLARSFAVQPGDRIFAEVYGKYVDPTSANWTSVLNTLITSIANGTAPAGTVVDGAGYAHNGTTPFPYAGLLNTSTGGDAPQAFLNYLLFDGDYNFLNGGFVRMSTIAKENGSDVPHEKLALDVTPTQPGYIYIYLSNEGSTTTEVFFDDFKVTHTGANVVQATDYGVWGDVLREQKSDTTKYRFGYQGQFAEIDTETGWNHFELREYDPVIGRWTAIDPEGQFDSPYAGMGNNPINGTDPNGGYFFKLFGSTREQRQTARALAKAFDGEVRNEMSKDISVVYTSWDYSSEVFKFTGDALEASKGVAFNRIELNSDGSTKNLDRSDADRQFLNSLYSTGTVEFDAVTQFTLGLGALNVGIAGTARLLSVSTAPSQALFWTGMRGISAAEFAAANGLTTLGMTTTGRFIYSVSRMVLPFTRSAMWRSASARFAAGASGDAFILSGHSARIGSVWMQVERQILMNNTRVTGVHFIVP